MVTPGTMTCGLSTVFQYFNHMIFFRILRLHPVLYSIRFFVYPPYFTNPHFFTTLCTLIYLIFNSIRLCSATSAGQFFLGYTLHCVAHKYLTKHCISVPWPLDYYTLLDPILCTTYIIWLQPIFWQVTFFYCN